MCLSNSIALLVILKLSCNKFENYDEKIFHLCKIHIVTTLNHLSKPLFYNYLLTFFLLKATEVGSSFVIYRE